MEKQSPSLYSPAIVAMETLAMTATLRLVKADLKTLKVHDTEPESLENFSV